VSNPAASAANVACAHWLESLALAGWKIIVPEIADYEVRRELLRAGKNPGIASLDRVIAANSYLALTTPAMRKAAEFWAQARQQGQPAAGDNTIDADMILAGQAATLAAANVIIATTNVKHLAPLVPAELWNNLLP
jgi:hypothetical protein